MESKKPWMSKTLWMNVLVAVSAIAYPPVSAWISKNPELMAGLWSVVNVVLRLVSKKELKMVA